MYNVLNKLSEYIYIYISKKIILYTFLLVLKIVESLQCMLKNLTRQSLTCSNSTIETLEKGVEYVQS